MRPFPCALLGREVADQLAVAIEHRAADGRTIRTELHHLDRVDVVAGQEVAAGHPVGTSGSSGCSSGPHLHLEAFVVDGGRALAVDPFGWSGDLPDPWASAPLGTRSPWLWRRAPVLVFEDERSTRGTVGLVAVRFRGSDDLAAPEVERISVAADPARRLDGWTLRLPDGVSVPLTGLTAAPGAPALVHPGRSLDRETLPDGGGTVELVDAGGTVVDSMPYGLAAHGLTVPTSGTVVDSRLACPPPGAGCVPIPLPGPVSSPVFGPDGALVVLVGSDAVPVVLRDGSGRVVDRLSGARGSPKGAARPGWLGPGVLVFDAPRADGVRTVWYAVPGLPAAEVLTGVAAHERRLADAVDGQLLLAARSAGDPDLRLWRVGDRGETLVTDTPGVERGAVLSRDGSSAAFLRDGRVLVADLEAGTTADLGDTAGLPTRLAWRDDGLLVLRGGVLLAARGGRLEPVREGLTAGLLATDGDVAAVVAGTEVVVLAVEKEERRLTLTGSDVSDLAVRSSASAPSGVEVAWVARFAPEAPPGLGRAP
jgi:hypothetical protein